jgi:replicative DNA helicase
MPANDEMPPPESEYMRVPPHSDQAEQAVLGAMMIDNTAWDRVGDILVLDHFYRYDHRLIYQHIVRLLERNQPADVVTVFESLSASNKADEVGGLPYLTTLVNNTVSAAGVRRHAEIVADKGRLRNLIGIADRIAEMGWDGSMDTEDKILQAGALIDTLADRSKQVDTTELSTVLSALVERIDDLYHAPDNTGITGVPTGFPDLDGRLSGMGPGELIVLAGRPSMGKSALAFHIAVNVAVGHRLPVYAWSGEMGAKQLARRMMSNVGRIDGGRLKNGKLHEDDWPRLTHAIQKLHEVTFIIDERPGLHINQLRAKARTLKRQHGALGLVVVDYIQLMTGTGDNRTGEIGSISRGLKQLAREMECPVLALSQLSRKCEERANKRPMMSDLRESGEIEQDSDVIMLMYRDDYYNPDSPDKGVTEINIAKSRDGETGLVPLLFRGEHSWFGSMEPGWRATVPNAGSKKGRGFE